MASKGNPNIASLDTSTRAELRNGKNTCQCASCGLFFTGVAPFDRHLVMDEEHPDNPPVCLTPAQMRSIGMIANVHGVWQYGKSKKAVKAA